MKGSGEVVTERRSADPDLFRADGDAPVLLGSRCDKDGESFYPRRWADPVRLGPVHDVELSQSGVLYSYSFIYYAPMFGKSQLDAEGYGVGQVDLPERVRIQTTLKGDPESWTIGEQMRLVHTSVDTTDDVETVLHSFTPTA